MPDADLLAIIEAAYAVEKPEQHWLEGLAEAAVGCVCGGTLGTFAQVYDVSDPKRPQMGQPCWSASDPSRASGLGADLAAYYREHPERVSGTYGSADEGLGLDLPGGDPDAIRSILHSWNVGDMYGINGRNPSGRGCIVGVYLPPGFRPLGGAARVSFARIARHLAAGYRLRGRTPIDEAVLRANGETVEAQGAAGDASEELRRAALAVARARRHRKDDPHRALTTWKALVDARWTLVDCFSSDGEQYLVARRNEHTTAPLALLSNRERQVAALVAMGCSNKWIGYELGIATSTVGVLVSRAMGRLGLSSRRALREAYLAQAPNPS
ncbi:MAG: helix-turn-helix transcriptional regulator [Polyangiaceae bacterium]